MTTYTITWNAECSCCTQLDLNSMRQVEEEGLECPGSLNFTLMQIVFDLHHIIFSKWHDEIGQTFLKT